MEKSKSSIKKNFIYQMMYEVLILLLPLITSPYIARVIGAEGLGTYSFSSSVAYYFVLFSMLGIKNYGNRTIAQCKHNQEQLNQTFSDILTIHILFSAVITVIYLLYIQFFASSKLYAALQIPYVLSGLFDISWLYFGLEKFKLTVTRSTLIKILNVTCVFTLVKGIDDLWKYCLIMSLCTLLSQVTLWIPLYKYVKILKFDKSSIRIHIKPMLVLFIPAIAISLYTYMDKIMVGSMNTKTELGYYENSEKIISIPMSIIGAFGDVMLPKMSSLVATDSKKTTLTYISTSMTMVLCLAFGLEWGIAGISVVFPNVFWGSAFSACTKLLFALSVTIPFIAFANVIRTQYLIPRMKDKEYLISIISGAASNVVINLLLISKIGAMGAVIGTVVTEILVCLIQCFAVRKELPLRIYIKNSWMFFFFGLVMFVIVYAVGHFMGFHVITLVVQVLSGVLVYGLISGAYFVKIKNQIIIGILNKGKSLLRKR